MKHIALRRITKSRLSLLKDPVKGFGPSVARNFRFCLVASFSLHFSFGRITTSSANPILIVGFIDVYRLPNYRDFQPVKRDVVLSTSTFLIRNLDVLELMFSKKILWLFNTYRDSIRSSEKFLSFYEEIIDAQRFSFYIILTNYVRIILLCWDKHRDISQTWFLVCVKVQYCKKHVCLNIVRCKKPNTLILKREEYFMTKY